MAKKGFYLDPETIEIVEKTDPKKQSDFVRKAIKFYHYNKDREIPPPVMKGEVIG